MRDGGINGVKKGWSLGFGLGIVFLFVRSSICWKSGRFLEVEGVCSVFFI